MEEDAGNVPVCKEHWAALGQNLGKMSKQAAVWILIAIIYSYLTRLGTLYMYNSHMRLFTTSVKVKKTAKNRKRYNQVPHLSQDTTWESNKNTINITNKSQ